MIIIQQKGVLVKRLNGPRPKKVVIIFSFLRLVKKFA